MKARIKHHLAAISQTFFLNHWLAGAGALVALLAFSPVHAIAGLVASVLTRHLATRMSANQVLIKSGLLELNGWYAGIAAATLWAPSLGLIVVVCLAATLTAVAAVILERLLATWDLPLLVAPYVLAFFLLWPALSSLDGATWLSAATWETLPKASSTLELILISGMRGLGQIFFCPDPYLGLALAIAVSLHNWKIGLAMIAASIAGVAVGFAYGAPLWQVEQGLFGFASALTAAAALKHYKGFNYGVVAASIVIGPLVEIGAIKLANAMGVYALSGGYVAMLWAFILLSPTKAAAPTSLWTRPSLSRL